MFPPLTTWTAVSLLLATGCGARTSIPAPESFGADASRVCSLDGASPFDPGDNWTGTYTCPQGVTNLDLVVVSTDGASIVALFDFTFEAITGSFYLDGTFDKSTGVATFQPGAWIDQPPGWFTVGMTGTVDVCASPMTYTGAITATGCGSFALTRQ